MTHSRKAVLGAAAAALLTLTLAQGCSGGSGPGGTPTPEAGPPTFTGIYNDILTPSCAQPFCHLGATTPMPLSDQMTAYMQTVNAPATGPYCAGMGTRVVPGHPESSILYEKIERPSPSGLCGGTMPGLGRPALDAADIERIRQWILMGAKND